MKAKIIKLITILIVSSTHIFADEITAQIAKTTKKGQALLWAALPLFALQIAYLYKRGKPEAKEKMENLVIGAIIAGGVFSLVAYFK